MAEERNNRKYGSRARVGGRDHREASGTGACRALVDDEKSAISKSWTRYRTLNLGTRKVQKLYEWIHAYLFLTQNGDKSNRGAIIAGAQMI